MKLKLGVTPKVTLKEGVERMAKDLLGEQSSPSK
jgi:hypothetical protein